MKFEEIRLSERVRRKLWEEHKIEEHEVYEAWFGRRVILRNKRAGRGTHRFVGQTEGGRVLTFPIRAAEDGDTWEVVTGFDSSEGERTLWKRRGQ